jgi:type IV pilus assembly protein PilO
MRIGLREIVFLLVLLAVPAVSLFYVFQPRNEEIKTALEEIRTKQDRLNRLDEVTKKIDDIGLAIEQGRESISLIEAKLPSERDVEGILEEVWSITASNGLTVKSVKTDKPLPAALYRELPLELSVEGQFDGFYQFLLELENLQRITRVHKLEIERAGSSSLRTSQTELPPGAMKASFTLSIYFEPESKNELS